MAAEKSGRSRCENPGGGVQHGFITFERGDWSAALAPLAGVGGLESAGRRRGPSYEPSAYVNAVDDASGDDDERVKSAYGPNYERLVALKNKYDPTNLFRLNANIHPTV